VSTFPTTTKIGRILNSGRKHQAPELTPDLPVAYGHSRDWAGRTIVTIGLPDLISTSRFEKVGRIIPSLMYKCAQRRIPGSRCNSIHRNGESGCFQCAWRSGEPQALELRLLPHIRLSEELRHKQGRRPSARPSRSGRIGLKSSCTSSNRHLWLWPYRWRQRATSLIFCVAGPSKYWQLGVCFPGEH
jgi:hypothetical protein